MPGRQRALRAQRRQAEGGAVEAAGEFEQRGADAEVLGRAVASMPDGGYVGFETTELGGDLGCVDPARRLLFLGETDEQVLEVIKDLHAAGCSIVTIGQYLPPTSQHHRLDRYVTPEQFEAYAAYGTSLGLKHVFSGPLVRSSYHAANFA